MGLMGRLVERVLVGTCLGSVNLILLGVAGLIRLLPEALRLIHFCLRGVLILSFRLYRLILGRLAPMMRQGLGLDLQDGFPRAVVCSLLSLALGAMLLILIRGHVTGWGLGLCLLHGLAVALAWDEIEDPGGLQLGTRTE
jgi:hypothetical protein